MSAKVAEVLEEMAVEEGAQGVEPLPAGRRYRPGDLVSQPEAARIFGVSRWTFDRLYRGKLRSTKRGSSQQGRVFYYGSECEELRDREFEGRKRPGRKPRGIG